MSSSQTAYTITITNGNTNSAPRDGFVDNKKIEDYYSALTPTPMSLTLVSCKAKRRGNVRYREIINQLSLMANLYVDDMTFDSDATAQTEATAFAFIVVAEHGDASLNTVDESSPPDLLTGTNAIKRCVARALINDMFREIDVYDPSSTTTLGTPGSTTSAPRTGTRIYDNTFEIGEYAADIAEAEALINVTMIVF